MGYQSHWDDDLQLLARALKSTRNRQTGFTPNMLLHRREVSLPIDIIIAVLQGNVTALSPHLSTVLPGIFYLDSPQVKQGRDYNIHVAVSWHEVGDLVYMVDSATKIGMS